MSKVFRVSLTHVHLGWLAEGQLLTYQASGEGEPDLLVQVELDPQLVLALDFLLAAESVEELLNAPVSGLPN